MTSEHERWLKSWRDALEEVKDVPFKERDMALFKIVWKKKVMNSIGKARWRARNHMAGVGRRHDAIVEITLAAEECPNVKRMSAAAKRVSESACKLLNTRGYDCDSIKEVTPDGVAYLGVRMNSIWNDGVEVDVGGVL